MRGRRLWRAVRATTVPVVCLAVLLALSTPAGTASHVERALYVWHSDDPDATVAFAREHGVTRLLVAVPPDVLTSPGLADLRTLVAGAHAHGIAVDALGGDPAWVDSPAWVIRHWVRPTLATGLFDGLHVDVEPYVTPAWDADRPAAVRRYVAVLTAVARAAGTTPVEADIPFWFDTVAGTRGTRLDAEVMSLVSGVTVMAYRREPTGPDGTLHLASAALAAAQAGGVRVRVGQLTTDLGPAPVDRKQSHAGTSAGEMAAAFAVIESALAGHPAYAGIAVHDVAGWQALEASRP